MTCLGAWAQSALSTELYGRARRRATLFLKQSWIHIGVHQKSPGRDRREKDQGQKLERREPEDQELEEQGFKEQGFEEHREQRLERQ